MYWKERWQISYLVLWYDQQQTSFCTYCTRGVESVTRWRCQYFWTKEILQAKKQTRKLEIPCVQDTHPAASTIRRSTRCQNSLTEPMSRMAMLRTSVQMASTRTLQTSWNSHSSQRQENHLDRSLVVNEICRSETHVPVPIRSKQQLSGLVYLLKRSATMPKMTPMMVYTAIKLGPARIW